MMAASPNHVRNARPIRDLRWWIGGLLFASTVINYIDRQTLSLLAPYLKHDFHWGNADYANLLIGFRPLLLDRPDGLRKANQAGCQGTKRGLTLSVLWYSIAP